MSLATPPSMSELSTEPAESLARDALRVVAVHSADAAQLRETGLMLRLLAAGPDGTVSTTTPWAPDDVDAVG